MIKAEEVATQTSSQQAPFKLQKILITFGLRLLIIGSIQLLIMISVNNIIQFIKFINVNYPLTLSSCYFNQKDRTLIFYLTSI
ncbi:hypothetical protein pb186bvf_019048 [Paramecium bursaria]